MFRKNRSEEMRNKTDKNLIQPSLFPKGILIHLSVDQIRPNPNNPRRLFDPEPLSELKESIRLLGVLVPITVYKLPGQEKYAIVDGERRFRCCLELNQEGENIQIPANIVEAPDKMASLIYMFNIHAFREQWELMPTALSLQEVIDQLKSDDSGTLHEITGLSNPQIERCKKILSFPQEFQALSLDPDQTKRIPSNFWVELYPVLEIISDVLPDLYISLGRNGVTQKIVEKYKAKKIKSVIHFRKIMEAFERAEGDDEKHAVADTLREFILSPDLDTRKAFDHFTQDTKIISQAVGACDKFIYDLERAKISYAVDGKKDIIDKLLAVVEYAQKLLDTLQGDEPPQEVGIIEETNGNSE